MRELTTTPGRCLPESWSRHRRHQPQYNRRAASSWIQHLVQGRGRISHHPIPRATFPPCIRVLTDKLHERVYLLVVDEVHAPYSWGRSFRVAFNHIGPIRDRFQSRLVMIGATATLLHAWVPDKQHPVFPQPQPRHVRPHRSNIRNDIRQIFRTLTHGGRWIQFL